MANILIILYSIIITVTGALATNVILSNNGPAVRGSNITFTATVIGSTGEEYKFVFQDFVQPSHTQEFVTKSNVTQWVVNYPRDLYESGIYTARVELQKYVMGMIWWTVANSNTMFNLTDNLNGRLTLTQNETLRDTFVAVNETVEHKVQISANEEEFLRNNMSSIVTYWFIDCVYIDQTPDFYLNHTYTDLMGMHLIDALVVAITEPLPLITTTPAPSPNSTVIPIISNSTSKSITKRSTKKSKTKSLGDFICNKHGIVPIDDSYLYGHFQLNISVRDPVHNVNITGLNWLQHGDLMNLQVKYAGSPPFNVCANYFVGQVNITGNETCTRKIQTMSNQFPLVHYFSNSEQYTVVIIVENVLVKMVSRATINIYKVTPHAQLSVIVVPVVFCLLAVILVVFGVAYYIQNKSRHTVEVADFDFGQQANLDYKTFVERLRDSFRNSFNCNTQEDEEVLTGASNNRYDSMT